MNRPLVISQERKLTSIFFFFYGFGGMSWLPRFPDIKSNLGISNGQFGTLISLTALGAIISFITVGHLVHRFGTLRAFAVLTTLLYGTFVAIVHCHSPALFLFLMIILGFAQAGFHITANAQAFDTQERAGGVFITGWHGMWSGGATLGALAGLLLVDHVSAAAHITTVAILCYSIKMSIVLRQRATLLEPGEGEDSVVNIKKIFTDFHFDWYISAVFVSACLLEHAVGDWGTIYSKEGLGINSGLSVLPYLLFSVMMITGRLYSSRLFLRYSADYLVKRAALCGSLGFAAFFFPAAALPESQKYLALGLTCIAFIFGGLGSSFIGPTFFNMANVRSPHPGAVVTGHFGTQNQILFFITKMGIAWTAQFTGSIAIALGIPTFLLFTVAFYRKVFKSV